MVNSFIKSCADGLHISVSGQSPFIVAKNSAIINNSGDDVLLTVGNTLWSSFIFENCVVDTAGGWGFHQTNVGGVQFGVINADAFRANTSGDTTFPASIPLAPTIGAKVTMTADCFTNRSSLDLSLNTTVGGGAACRGAGYPGALTVGGTGAADIGPLQHADPQQYLGGSGAGMSSIMAM